MAQQTAALSGGRVTNPGPPPPMSPELAAQYFRNYRRLVYLAQVDAPERVRAARAAAQRLGLAFEHRITGYGGLATSLQATVARIASVPAWQS